jgi:hypothetical protein
MADKAGEMFPAGDVLFGSRTWAHEVWVSPERGRTKGAIRRYTQSMSLSSWLKSHRSDTVLEGAELHNAP